MKRMAILFGLVLWMGQLAVAQTTYQNPVIRGDVSDPSIIRWGDTYYAAGSSSEWAPYYPLFKSTDLVNWEQIGHIFPERPEWTHSSFWAPELYVHNGQVFCYYTARKKENKISYVGVAVADNPEGPYIDHGPLVDFGTEDIDGYVFDDNGTLYISWKAHGLDPQPIEINGCQLAADGLHLTSEPKTWLVDDEGIGMEGQCQFKWGDWYYLLYSAMACCGPWSNYEVRVARSKSVQGPYEFYEDNPILKRGAAFKACGHGSLVDTPDGRLFYMCHAYQWDKEFYRGRQPILQELVMGDDEWPHFTTGRIATLTLPTPFEGTVQQLPAKVFADTFDEDKLRVEWSWNYVYNDVNASPCKGELRLSGTPVEGTCGAALCLRPSTTKYDFAATVVSAGDGLSGITYYGDNKGKVVLGVREKKLQLLCTVGGKDSVFFETPCKAKRPQLKGTVVDGCQLTFSYCLDGKTWQEVPVGSIDGSKILPWDRVPRPGFYTDATPRHPARFDDFCLTNQE